MANKKIDVIIPAYNNSQYLPLAIQSVLNQTYKPNKIIVVDDGSQEDLKKVVKKIKSEIPIEYYKQENAGPNAARNNALQYSTAKYLAFLDSDDEWKPEKLERQMNVFETSDVENLGVVYCGYIQINEQGELHPTSKALTIDPTFRGNVYDKLLIENKVTSSASGVLIKREFIDQVGKFDETLRIGEDWEMWIRLSKVCGYDFADEKLVKIRKHEGNHQSKTLYVFENEMKLYNKLSTDEPREEFQHIWSLYILNKIIAALPNKEFLKIANQVLSSETKMKFFKSGWGNIRLYLIRLTITQYLRFFVAHLSYFFGITFKAIRNFFILLLP